MRLWARSAMLCARCSAFTHPDIVFRSRLRVGCSERVYCGSGKVDQGVTRFGKLGVAAVDADRYEYGIAGVDRQASVAGCVDRVAAQARNSFGSIVPRPEAPA